MKKLIVTVAALAALAGAPAAIASADTGAQGHSGRGNTNEPSTGPAIRHPDTEQIRKRLDAEIRMGLYNFGVRRIVLPWEPKPHR